MSINQPDFKEVLGQISRLIAVITTVLLLMVAVIFIGVLASGPREDWHSLYVESPDVILSEKMTLENAVEYQSQEIQYGYDLITNTDQLIGMAVDDESMRYTGNVLRCSSCHLQGGTQSYGISLVGVTDRFPQFRGRENKEGTLSERINGCMTRSMNGIPLPEDGKEMKAMLAYISWLDDYFGEDASLVSPGLKPIELPNRAVDLAKGEAIFNQQCTVCHQSNGQGLASSEDSGASYTYPPLWGDYSYNNGAGMHRVITAAQFIKYNMPFGITHESAVLSDEDAYDVAGYMNSHHRPLRDHLDLDFPDRKRKPMSTPYGPYADDFSLEQHKYGPYPPIAEYYKEVYQMTKKK